MIFNPKTGVVLPLRHKNIQKNRSSQVERFMNKKVIAMAVFEVLSSFAITFGVRILFFSGGLALVSRILLTIRSYTLLIRLQLIRGLK
jgi:hypothetical protein